MPHLFNSSGAFTNLTNGTNQEHIGREPAIARRQVAPIRAGAAVFPRLNPN
jgi:hypothetical protein